jgi:glycosyltransferase involved in cell wall biosynthesis
MPPRISIIIPAYNEEDYLPATLEAVRAAAEGYGDDVEVVVCDNGSTDGTRDVAERYGAAVVFEPHRQIARARNTGARHSTGDLLIFIDADTSMHPDLVKRVDELLLSGSVIGGGAFAVFDRHWDAKLVSRLINYCCLLVNRSWGACLYCDRESFRAIGGFDESLYGLEELAFAKALAALGRKAGKDFKVISELTNVTSARRLDSRWRVLRTRLPFVWRTGRKIRDREACGPVWYDVER